MNVFSHIVIMGHTCPDAGIGSISSFRTDMLSYLTKGYCILGRCAAVLFILVYRLFGLTCVGIVDDSLKSFRRYVGWHSRNHRVKRQYLCTQWLWYKVCVSIQLVWSASCSCIDSCNNCKIRLQTVSLIQFGVTGLPKIPLIVLT